jgi:hypothetical protein
MRQLKDEEEAKRKKKHDEKKTDKRERFQRLLKTLEAQQARRKG